MGCDYCSNKWEKELGETRAVFIDEQRRKYVAYKDNCHINLPNPNHDIEIVRRFVLSVQIFGDALNATCWIDNNPSIDDLIDERDEFQMNIPIHYCPMCGRKLREAANE